MLPADVTLAPVTEPDFPAMRELAATIWQQHYTGIISALEIFAVFDVVHECRFEEQLPARQRTDVDLYDSPIDRLRYEQLLRGGSLRIAHPRGATAC